jgi:hypothetical protein
MPFQDYLTNCEIFDYFLQVRVMEQQLSEATSANNAGSWGLGEEAEKLCTLQNAVREKERVISRLECQVEEQVICLSLFLTDAFLHDDETQVGLFPLTN